MVNEADKARVLLLATAQSYRTAAFEAAAERLGVQTRRGRDAPLPMMKDLEAGDELLLDYRDLETSSANIEAYAEEHPVAAILGLDDSGTLLAARASERLGLQHNDVEAALAARSKHVMRQKFAAAGAPSPKFRYCRVDEEVDSIAAEVSFPCVVKPATLSGSRGVMRANTAQELGRQIERLKRILARERCEEFLVEDYIPGVEVALEGLMEKGKLHTLAIFDKPDPLEGPFFEETIYVTPSRLSEEKQNAVIEAAAQGAEALGLRTGPVHAEMRVNDQGAWLLEMAGRSIGGRCSESLHFQMDMTLEELILRQALGMDVSGVKRIEGAEGVMMIPIPGAGLLKGVQGVEAARAVPGVTGVEISAQLNQRLTPLPEGDSYLGFIFARGERPEQVEAALREAHAKLRFELEQEIRLESKELRTQQ